MVCPKWLSKSRPFPEINLQLPLDHGVNLHAEEVGHETTQHAHRQTSVHVPLPERVPQQPTEAPAVVLAALPSRLDHVQRPYREPRQISAHARLYPRRNAVPPPPPPPAA